jgi:DNA (cytosine-5)-methyltransferase 1
MNKVELFSGTGGFSKAFLDAGYNFEKVVFSEIDKHAIANYKYNFKNHLYGGSVIDITGNQLPRTDIISFGSPCQDFSLAGTGAGLQGKRSSLIREAIRIIAEKRPSIFIWENVKGTYSSNNGRDFQAILREFANIGGYRLEWQLLNTSWFLPQNRERIYLIGHLDGRSVPGVFPFREDDELFVKPTKTRQGQPQTQYCTTLKSSGAMKADDTYIIPKNAGCLSGGGNSGGLHSHTTVIPVESNESKGLIQKDSTKGNSQGTRIYDPNGISSTLNSGGGGLGGKTGLYDVMGKVRRLTEIECERLQGFPDDWTKYGDYEGVIKEISRSQRYKLLGNAVSVPVVRAIAERLKRCIINY